MQPHVKTFCRRWLFSLAIALLLLTSLQSFAPAQNNPEPMEDGGNLSAPTTVIVEPETTGAIAIEGVPVVLGDQELFYIQAKIASFSPEFRAKVISQRLITFAKTMEIEPDQLTIVNNEATQTTDIMAGEVTLVTIADVDAVAAGQSRQVLGRLYLEAIKNAVVDFRESYSLQNIIQGGIYSVIATIIFIFGIILVNRGTHFTNHKLKVWTGQNQKGLNLFNTEILSPPRLASLMGEIIKTIRFAIVFGLIYLYVNLVLSFFPWTQGLARILFGYVKTAFNTLGQGILDYLPNLFFLA